jgi:hypothetical protein
MEQEPGKEKPKLSLLENFDACFDAVKSIELQWSPTIDESSFQFLRESMNVARNALTDKIAQREKRGEKIHPNISLSGFEGVHGFNRYEVLPDGTVVLSRSHSIGPCIKKAEELGIEVSEY